MTVKTLLRCRLFVAAVLLVSSVNSYSCPAYVKRDIFRPGLPSVPRQSFALFAVNDQKKWKRIPLQVDPANQSKRLLFFNDKEDFMSWNLDANDRISFYTDDLGQRFQKSMGLPCDTDYIYEMRTIGSRKVYAYLADCSRDPKYVADRYKPTIQHDAKKNTVFSENYDYTYHVQNHMMFDKIFVKPPGNSEKKIVGFDSAQRIRADVKNFFTMNFSNEDIESKLITTREGPVALLGKLTFYLHILFFKIDMQLNTIVSFYNDSVHMPMTINMPVHTYKFTRPSSGMNFTWKIPKGVVWDKKNSTIRSLAPGEVKKGYEELAKYGLKNCKLSRCSYMLSGKLDGFQWGTEFFIPKALVKRGFFPMFMEDVPQAMVDLGWEKKVSKVNADREVGLYFETSGLEKGQHEFDFWIKMGTKEKPVTRKCPTPLLIRKRIPVSKRILEIQARGLDDILLEGETLSDVLPQAKLITLQAEWEELLEQLEYDIEVPSRIQTVNFRKHSVIAVVASDAAAIDLQVKTPSKKAIEVHYKTSGVSTKKRFVFALIPKVRDRDALKFVAKSSN